MATIMGVRLGFEIVTPSDVEDLGVDDGSFGGALILDLFIFRLVFYKV